MRFPPIPPLFTIALGLLAGCATTPEPLSQADPAFDFGAVETFAMRPLPDAFPGNNPGAVLRLGKPAMAAVVTALTEAGYTETDSGNADILVEIIGSSRKDIDVRNWGYRPVASGYGRDLTPVWTQEVTVREREDSLVALRFFNGTDGQLVWVGWISLWGTLDRYEPGDFVSFVLKILGTSPLGMPPAGS